MRILFLCSSLEPGRDGVGDYVRQLAAACLKQGHTCALLALHDPFVAEVRQAIERTEHGEFPILRIRSWAETNAAIAFRERFAPDWVSLQLVAYGLDPKGFLFRAKPRLRSIVDSVPLHLMLHELWLGNEVGASLRHRFNGFLQRVSLRRLITALHPQLISTTNPVYAALLKEIGIQAGILPLFGNIPIATRGELPEAVSLAHQNAGWLGLFFGGLYPEWKAEPFLGRLARATQSAGRRVSLVSAGYLGEDGEKVWSDLVRNYGSVFRFFQLGPQPAPVISGLMQAADFGIAGSPWTLIGKSGSAAAMLDHGLPVIVTREDFRPRLLVSAPPSTDPLLHRCDDELEEKLAAGLVKRPPHSRVNEIASRLTVQMIASGVSRL